MKLWRLGVAQTAITTIPRLPLDDGETEAKGVGQMASVDRVVVDGGHCGCEDELLNGGVVLTAALDSALPGRSTHVATARFYERTFLEQ